MARVALVTGGSRGIGAAVSKALKATGCKVAASYAGNDEAAQAFKAQTGIPVFKWDVSSAEACAAGIKQVEAELGPIVAICCCTASTMRLRAWPALQHHRPPVPSRISRPSTER